MAWIKGCDAPEDANNQIKKICCPLCGHLIQTQQHQAGIQELPGLPAGVKFDPSDHEILEHLEGKVRPNARNHHPLIDEFIPTLDGDNGICYTHPEKLPGVKRDGLVRHFFHRPSKAYTTGTRKRRKVHTNEEGGETRWHKTGKTRAILSGGSGTVMGHKKILVLYTNYGRQRRPEKTNWVMHQYHLGSSEDEKDGELVVSKVFYQTQPRQCGSGAKDSTTKGRDQPYSSPRSKDTTTSIVDYYDELSIIAYDQQVVGHHRESPPAPLMTQSSYHSSVHHDNGSSFLA